MFTYIDRELMLTHYYFCEGVLHKADKWATEWDEGQLGLVYELADYSFTIETVGNEALEKHGDFPGVFCYEFAAEIAADVFVAMLSEGNGLPDMGSFKKLIEDAIEAWINK